MAGSTQIEWTNATWNPVTGCTKISSGCDHCYAERFAERFRGVKGHPFENGFDVTLRPERLAQPRSWKKSKMIFVNSMSDLFHKSVSTEFVDEVFDVMEECSHHIFQLLTKRSSRLKKYVNARYQNSPVPEHIWLGVSVEDDQKKSRVRHLSDANASIRFISIEPLIGPITKLNLNNIDWVIVGGESGPNARTMEPSWVEEIKSQCDKAKVAFFFKQWGGFRPKSGGRIFSGAEWNEYPRLNKAHPVFHDMYQAA